PLGSGHLIVLEVEDRQVEIAVAEVVARGAGAVHPGDLLHAEDVDVELRGLVHVLGRDGDVLDLRHGLSPLSMVRAGLACLPGRVGQRRPKRQDIDPRPRPWCPSRLIPPTVPALTLVSPLCSAGATILIRPALRGPGP